jgi:hypothetical protein
MPKPIKIDLGDGNQAAFSSAEELNLWCLQERETWKWLGDQPLADRRLRVVWQQFDAFYQQIQQAAAQHATPDAIADLTAPVQRAFDQFVKTKRVAIRETVHGSRILGILTRLGGTSTDEARARATWAQYHVAALENPEPIGAAFARTAATALFDYHNEQGSEIASELAVRQLLARAASELNANKTALAEATDKNELMQRQWNNAIASKIEELEQQAKAAVSSIEEVQELFRNQMGLQAPVQYWTEKAKKHKDSAKSYKWALIWYSVLALPACLGLYAAAFLVAVGLLGAVAVSVSASLLAFGALALLTTAALWGARIVSRLYLSQQHLGIDADERATMVTTYLALANEKAADEKDRAIVLAALFRPTADGVVKDDGLPMTAPSALFSGLLSPTR